MLYPIENEIRECRNLNGIWKFRADVKDEGFDKCWFVQKLTETMPMPVPASYNDIVTNKKLREHVGWVWYEKEFYLPKSWEDKRIVLRFGSVTHHAVVWLDGVEIARNKGGFLPFEVEIDNLVKTGSSVRLTVAVSNILDWTCIPPGEVITPSNPELYPEGYRYQEVYFDFFNYSGIHRPVRIYTTPKKYIEDVTVKTDLEGVDGLVSYEIKVNDTKCKDELSKNQNKEADKKLSQESANSDLIHVELKDENGITVAEGTGTKGVLKVKNAHLWEPGAAYLYQLHVSAGEDSYELAVGIRTIKVSDKFYINGKPFYFKGFGKHEDSDIRGKGLDEALNVRDFSLMKWIGANSFRTSHYPYSEEIMQLADREGIVIIDEVPAVGMCFWGSKQIFIEGRVDEKTLEHHCEMLKQLYTRDKNHPCVVMWSISNEPATYEEASLPYFTKVAETIRNLEDSRPITIVQTAMPKADHVAQLCDVVCVNRYYAWYEDHGHLETIAKKLKDELDTWHKKYGKPVFVTEYGADTLPGMHQLPEVSFTEEFQMKYMQEHFKIFDSCDYLIGEHVWVFADFATKQEIRRINGSNAKGVFTRQRQPKMVAYILRKRWTGEEMF